MTDKILNALKQKVHEFALVPAGGGCFEVTVDGELLHSKLKTGVFPREDDIVQAIAARAKR